MHHFFRNATARTLVASLVFTLACTGSDSISPANPGDSPTPGSDVSVTITPAVDSLGIGESRVLTARVADDRNILVDRPVTWTSTNPALVTVNATGLVTGVAAGTARIVAAAGSVADTAVLVVRASESPFQIMPNAASVALGQSLQMSIASSPAAYGAGPVVWSTSDATIATVTPDGVVSTSDVGDVLLTASIGGVTSSAAVKVTRNGVASVSVTPTNSTLLPGQATELQVTLLDESGRPTTGRPVKWSSSNSSVATVSNNGIAKGVGKGSAVITATSEGKTSSATVNVLAVPVATVSVTLGTPSLSAGQTTTASALLKDADGVTLTGRIVAWQSSNPALATVTAAGLVAGIAPGSVTISAISEGKIGDAALTVTAPTPARVTVSPATTQLNPGATQQLSATIVDASGAVLTNRPITWASSNVTAVSVSSSGVVTAIGAGTAVVTATSAGVSGTAAVAVTAPPAPVASVTVVLPTTTLLLGQSMQASVVVRDGAGAIVPTPPAVTWSTSNVDLASVSATGLVTAEAPGSATIIATVAGVTGAQTLTISPPPVAAVTTVSLSASVTTLAVGQATQLVVTLRDAAGQVIPSSGRTIGFSSSSPAIATISSGGMITGNAAGSAVISASSEGVTGTLPISVTAATPPPPPPPPTVETVSVTLNSAGLQVGQTTQATAVARDASGNVISGAAVTWSSSNTSVASVSGSGLVTAAAGGSAAIVATSGGKSGSQNLSVTVPPAPVAMISLTINPTALTVGQTVQAVASPRDAAGNALTGRVITWSSSNSAVAAVTSQGLVTAVAAGSASVTAASEGKSSAVTVSVTAPAPPPPPPSGIAILPGESIQAKVDANPAGTTFILKAGTHVRQSVVPKDGNVFRGETGTVLDGQNATAFAFRGWSGSRWINTVTVRNLTITRYTPPAQNGAIWGGDDLTNSTTGWTLDSLEISYSTNLGLRIGNRMRVLRSVLHHNGTINIGGVGRAVLVDGIESAYGNNGCVKDPGFESGGSKFVKTDSLIVRNSFFHHNCGVGLWLDIDNINALLENNRVEDNVREGICIEVSYKTTIRNNILRRNGWPTDSYRPNGWLWDAAIGVHASSDVEIYGNTLEENFNGIVAIQQPRGPAMSDIPGPYGPYIVQNLYVHDNTVYQRTAASGGDGSGSGAAQDVGDTSIFTSRNNRWVRNTYYVGTNARPFAWMNGWRTAAEWRAYGQDVTGSFNP